MEGTAVVETKGRHPGGRPSKGDNRRDVRVTVQITGEEAARFKARADERGLSTSAYIRQQALLALKADEMATP